MEENHNIPVSSLASIGASVGLVLSGISFAVVGLSLYWEHVDGSPNPLVSGTSVPSVYTHQHVWDILSHLTLAGNVVVVLSLIGGSCPLAEKKSWTIKQDGGRIRYPLWNAATPNPVKINPSCYMIEYNRMWFSSLEPPEWNISELLNRISQSKILKQKFSECAEPIF